MDKGRTAKYRDSSYFRIFFVDNMDNLGANSEQKAFGLVCGVSYLDRRPVARPAPNFPESLRSNENPHPLRATPFGTHPEDGFLLAVDRLHKFSRLWNFQTFSRPDGYGASPCVRNIYWADRKWEVSTPHLPQHEMRQSCASRTSHTGRTSFLAKDGVNEQNGLLASIRRFGANEVVHFSKLVFCCLMGARKAESVNRAIIPSEAPRRAAPNGRTSLRPSLVQRTACSSILETAEGAAYSSQYRKKRTHPKSEAYAPPYDTASAFAYCHLNLPALAPSKQLLRLRGSGGVS